MHAAVLWSEGGMALDETEIEGFHSAEIPQILFRIANNILRERRLLSSRPDRPTRSIWERSTDKNPYVGIKKSVAASLAGRALVFLPTS